MFHRISPLRSNFVDRGFGVGFGLRFVSRRRVLKVRRPNIPSSKDKWQGHSQNSRPSYRQGHGHGQAQAQAQVRRQVHGQGHTDSNADSMPPYKFGSYPSLKLPDERKRQGIARLVSKVDDFRELKLLPQIRSALLQEIKQNTVLRSQNYMSSDKKVKSENELNGLIIRPTPIQTAGIKMINAKRSAGEFLKVFTLAAETGSGKTWAYLAPLLQSLAEEDMERGGGYVELPSSIPKEERELSTSYDQPEIADEVNSEKSEVQDEQEGPEPEELERPKPEEQERPEPSMEHLHSSSSDSSPSMTMRSRPSKPGIRSIILLPTHELVDQVYSVIDHTASTLGTRVFRFDTDSNFKVFMQSFRHGIDVLVTTPPKLLSLTRYDSVRSPRALLGSVRFCVVDEADTLMDESFVQDTYNVIKNMSNLTTLVFSSATIPSQFNNTIQRLFPEAVSVSTPSLHKLPKAIEFRVINASVSPYKGSKMKALAQTLYAIHCDGSERGYEKRVIVFVNNKEDCAKVAERLRDKYGHEVVYISGDDTAEDRKAKVQTFIDPPRPLGNSEKPVLKVLVCTDLLSRGLNFRGIRNVILLDVPHNSADLVHRSGRTGRMNQSGRVFLLINDQDKSHVKGLPKVLRNNRRLG
ncbi:DEKNAAC103606 [Brettanomyces naardenensis]|uniref:RNA helicase n=1 Tax=Brettanomyces naardenensis TaxID=13370 RepID=A0A448YMW2_BRENA|nr:DEKNAAC103606 [Brettanomyces naardenensis]